MHVSLMVSAIAVAILLRLSLAHRCFSHWLATLALFVVPPLLLLTTALSIIIMGPHGHVVVTHIEGWLSYGAAWGYLLITLGILGHLRWQAHISIQHIQQYPHTTVQGTPGRLLNDGKIFSAQIGLWSSELVVSQGLLDALDRDHLAAVIAHEKAHAYYHDTFWFFWLGWLKRISSWLPYTESLWQELLLLREIRADRWAIQSVEKLTLAESLLQVIGSPLSPITAANFSCIAPLSRLNRRIDALLLDNDYGFSLSWAGISSCALVSLIPLLSIPFHY
ncbi:M56 family metallopeptidase [Leptothoe kymatousa TAU-MAC 1615]|uniref:M56 family metallopeptidase n=2 Tax=Leptothoe TaxID=2651725 RepID=A0ABS5Y3I9_9CYAN|nr:M56 family metallopeptidase [Leptothoe kymatousa TAU-MAC 1615]